MNLCAALAIACIAARPLVVSCTSPMLVRKETDPRLVMDVAVGASALEESLSVSRLARLGYVTNPAPVSVEEMQHVDTSGMVPNTLADGHVIYSYQAKDDEHISAELALFHTFEKSFESRLCKEVNNVEGAVDILDVGGNIGTYSIPLAVCLKKRGVAGKVLSIEAMPDIAHHLEASVFHNDLQNMVEVYNYAVSDGSEAAETVKMSLDAKNKGGSNVIEKNAPRHEHSDGIVDVKVTTLDSILLQRSPAPRIFVMKMDIEGFEGLALKGAKHFMSATPPCLLQIEISASWLSKVGTPVDMLVTMLQQWGYDVPPIPTQFQYTTVFYQKELDHCRARFASK